MIPSQYNYIIGPISSIAKLQLNMNPEYDDPPFKVPKINLFLEMEKLNVYVTSKQFQYIVKLADSMNRLKLGAPYRKYRPFNKPYKNHYKEWWQFAITAILEENIKKKNRGWSWLYIKEHRQLCSAYAMKYKEKELSKKISNSLLESCLLLEQKLDIFNLILIRQQVNIEVQRIKREQAEKGITTKTSWLGGWFGGGQKNEKNIAPNIVKKFEAAMTTEEKSKLYKAIGYQENALPLNVPEDFEAISLNFRLIALEIGLFGGDEEEMSPKQISLGAGKLQTIMLMKFSMTTCSIQQWPAANSIRISAGMKEMKLSGLEKNSIAPTIIESIFTGDLDLLDICFEINPLDKKCDQRIKVLARPLQIVYDSDTILHLVKVFAPPKTVNLSELEGAATEQMANFKERSATGMQYIIDKRDKIDIDIKFMPNTFVLPYKGEFVSRYNSLIVVSLGQLKITSQDDNMSGDIAAMFESGKDQQQILKNVMEKSYNNFKIAIEDIQALVVKQNEKWRDVLASAKSSEMHILEPTSITVEIGLCIVDDDPRLPKTKVDILLPSIHINITEDRIFEAINVVTSIPLPESDSDESKQLLRSISSSSILSVTNFLNQEINRGKSKDLETSTIASEIVQYTSLNLNFALKEVGVTLYKSCLSTDITAESPTDSNKYGTPEEEITYGNEDFEETMSYVMADAPPITQKILEMRILQLEANIIQRTYESVLTAKLGAVNLTQYDNCEKSNGKSLSIIDTPYYSKDLKYLLTVSYLMANKTSPEFATKYNSIEQLLIVKFSTLKVTLHQEYLLYLMEIANILQRKFDGVQKEKKIGDRIGSAANGQIITKLTTIMEEPLDISMPLVHERKDRRTKVVESIKFKIVADLEQVGLFLTCRKRDLASLNINHFNASVVLKSSYTELNLQLRDIVLTDLNPENIHNKILSIIGQNAFDSQIVIYNLTETANYNSDDIKITVDIGCMKIVFLNWFVNSILSFLNNFQAAQEALAQASAAAADAARQNALDAYEKATRIKLNIKIKAPIIVVPVDSKSLNGVALDLGFLMLSNSTSEIHIPGNDHSPAIVDEIKLKLKDMKLSKVSIIDSESIDNEISVFNSTDTIDLAYGLKSDVNIMDPISFTLGLKRNLSTSWYKDIPEIDFSGRLKSIELHLFMEDYALLMSILSRNLNEGHNEFPTIDASKARAPSPILESKKSTYLQTRPTFEHQTRREEGLMGYKSNNEKTKNIYEQLKFNFQFDGVIANLKMGANEGLARFGLYFLSIKGSKLINGTLSTSIVLCNIQIDDTRPNTTSKIKKYLCRRDWKNMENGSPTKNLFCGNADTYNKAKSQEVCETNRNYMLDITAILKENDIFAEVRVCGFDLILCIDFLLKLADFFTIPEELTSVETVTLDQKISEQKSPKHGINQTASVQIDNSQNLEKKISIILYIEEPDIILIESLEDTNTNAIIFNAQAQLNYRAVGEKQIINGQVDALKMYMCSFLPEKREVTKHYIIHPCVISLQGSTPEEEGLHISLKLSDIIINVSPATIELFNKAMLTINADSAEKTAVQKQESDYRNIWIEQKFTEKDYWFIKVEEAKGALEDIVLNAEYSTSERTKTEKCIVEIPSITLIVEAGVGYYTTPLLTIDTCLNAIISDWSRNLSINGSLTLDMSYYNQALASWEPIIEHNERMNHNGKRSYLPWELNFKLEIESKPSDFDENVEEQTTKIEINSEENLEITISKTCVDLMGVLGEIFSQAIDSKGLAKPEVIAPYIIENDTGFDISINFSRGIFTLHECHIPKGTAKSSLNRSLIFKTAESNILPEQIKDCTISSGGSAFLQTKDLSKVNCEEDEEYNIYVKIGSIEKEVILPVSKSDKRYFPLYRDINQDPWGIVSEVRSEYGTTKINIHGVVNVHNHFSANIKIYRRKHSTHEYNFVGDIRPREVFNLPLHAIYSEAKELFFALEGYNISVQGMKWNDCPTDLSYSRQIQCDPIDTFEPFYINAVREKTEVYHENTNKFKLLSAVYTIHLRPPLYLRNDLPINIRVSVVGCSGGQTCGKSAIDADSNEINNISAQREELLDYGEKEVHPGDVLHLPTVKFSSKNKEGKSYLVVRLIQYLEKDWSCTTEISENHEDIVVWTFSSYDSESRMDMDLCVRMSDRFGSLLVTLYSPFWMINKTGLMLSYKTDTETVDVLYHPPEYNGPILFSFREKFFFDKKRASIRVDNGEWSEKIPLDVAGSIGEVTCKANDLLYQIGVHNHLTHNSLTKQITFIPFYIATNKCDFAIELQEQSRPGDPWIKIEAHACVPIWPKNDSDHKIVAKVNGLRTVPFDYTEIQCILLKLAEDKFGGINVDVQATEGGVYISFLEYNPGDAPGLLINYTSKTIRYHEKGLTERNLKSQHQVLFTWSEPAGEKCLIFGENNVESDLRRDNVGEIVLNDNSKAYWVSFLDGLQRILLFTEIETIARKTESSAFLQTVSQSIEIGIHGIGISVLNNITGVDIMYLGITNSGIIWEYKKENKKRFKQMSIHETTQMENLYQEFLIEKKLNKLKSYSLDGKHEVDFVKMVLKKTVDRDIRRTFYPGVWISIKTSPYQTQLHTKINKIQLDNQLVDCIFPVVLAAIAPPKSVATTTALKPFIECSIVERLVPNSTVKQYKYASMLIQEFHFKVDLVFLTAIAEMFTGSISDEQAAKLFNEDVEAIEKPLTDLVLTTSIQEQKNFYDNLHLGPLKIHVSFSMAGSDISALPGLLSTLVQGVGVTLTDVNDVVFRLAFFQREYQFFTQRQLTSEISAHYTGQALKQLYVLVLGLDVLGNPYGLVVGLKKGVEDLFYEPFQGAIQGPGEFAEGLVLGVKSLFGHTVGGAAGAVSKITGAMGKGLAALTFDEDYQKKRREAINRKPANFQEGIARSGKGLVMGFVDGVTGVVTKPVSGAREEGVEGFFKGLGKGAIGLVARPTAGVVDFASGSFDAVKRAAESSEDTKRLRPARFLHHDKLLRPYCRSEAEGNKLLKEIEKGKYGSTDTFVHLEEVVHRREILLISNHRLLYATKNDLFGTWTVQWTFLWHEISAVSSNDRGVIIALKKEGKKILGIFSQEAHQKIIFVAQKSKRDEICEIIESQRNET